MIWGVSEHPIFARFYDRMTAGSERAGLAEMRRELVASATGRTLELGAGSAQTLPYYPDAVTELVLAEPEQNMAEQLRDRLREMVRLSGRASVIDSPAEQLPFD